MKPMWLNYPVPALSRMLKVSISGYYAWEDRPLSERDREELRLELEIKAAHKRTRQAYGAEKMQYDLAEHGIRVGICRIKRIRRKLGLYCMQKRKFKATTNSRHNLPVARNLLNQQFRVYEPNKVWVSDITYIPTDEGWLLRWRIGGMNVWCPLLTSDLTHIWHALLGTIGWCYYREPQIAYFIHYECECLTNVPTGLLYLWRSGNPRPLIDDEYYTGYEPSISSDVTFGL
jgi:hypothetical protein